MYRPDTWRGMVDAGASVPVLGRWTMPQAICHLDTRRGACRSARTTAFIEAIRRWCKRESTA